MPFYIQYFFFENYVKTKVSFDRKFLAWTIVFLKQDLPKENDSFDEMFPRNGYGIYLQM